MAGVRTCRVSPFGHLWINACLRLPTAFRSLPRPSSAISARASSLCSYSLDLFWLPHVPSSFPSGPRFHPCSLSCLLRSRFQSSSLSGFPSPRSRSQCASRLFSVQFSRNDLRPTPENDIVRKEEEPSVPSILVPFTRFPWRSTWDCDELLHHILPRKEVIQPHLPIRLPCYDFTPVIGLTFGSSSPFGLGH